MTASSEPERTLGQRQAEDQMEDDINADGNGDARDQRLQGRRAQPPAEEGGRDRGGDEEARFGQRLRIGEQNDDSERDLAQPTKGGPGRRGVGPEHDDQRRDPQQDADDDRKRLGADRVGDEADLDGCRLPDEERGQRQADGPEKTITHRDLPSRKGGRGRMAAPRFTVLLQKPDLARDFFDLGDGFRDIVVEGFTLEVERRQSGLRHGGLPFVRGIGLGDRVDPILVGVIRHAARRVEPAPVGADCVEALLLGGRELGEAALQTLGRQHRQNLDVTRVDKPLRLGGIAREGLHRARKKLRHRLAAAVEGNILDGARIIDACGFGGDQHLQVVPATHGRAARERDAGGVRLHLLKQFRQRVERRGRSNRDDAVIGAHRSEPTHLVHRVAREGALREPRGRGGRGCHDQVVVVVALVDHLGESHTAAAARDVADLHGAGDELEILHRLADLTAGEVPATARIGGRDALGRLGLESHRRAARHRADDGEAAQHPAQGVRSQHLESSGWNGRHRTGSSVGKLATPDHAVIRAESTDRPRDARRLLGDGNKTMEWLPAVSGPGDQVTFRAHNDTILVLSCCPMDLLPINGEDAKIESLERKSRTSEVPGSWRSGSLNGACGNQARVRMISAVIRTGLSPRARMPEAVAPPRPTTSSAILASRGPAVASLIRNSVA